MDIQTGRKALGLNSVGILYPQCDDNQLSHACPICIYYELYTSFNIDACYVTCS